MNWRMLAANPIAAMGSMATVSRSDEQKDIAHAAASEADVVREDDVSKFPGSAQDVRRTQPRAIAA
jgi:hypothetical protein